MQGSVYRILTTVCLSKIAVITICCSNI